LGTAYGPTVVGKKKKNAICVWAALPPTVRVISPKKHAPKAGGASGVGGGGGGRPLRRACGCAMIRGLAVARRCSRVEPKGGSS